MQPGHLYVYRRGKRVGGRDDGSDFRKTAKYSNENLCLHYEFLYSVAFA